MVDWIGLAFPFAYLTVLIGSLATFSSLYRRRKAAKAASLAPWFPPHLQRNVYLSLLHHEPTEKNPKIPDSVLRAALLRRATEDIHRIIAIRSSKQALSTLLQRGSVGDELWQRFLRAEKEMEEELRDVVNEANAFQQGWGQTIFQSASEMANNQVLRSRLTDIQAELPQEKEWWDRKKASISSDFMQELEEESTMKKKSATVADESGKTDTTSPKHKESDDDAVLVESGGPAEKSAEKKKKKGTKK